MSKFFGLFGLKPVVVVDDLKRDLAEIAKEAQRAQPSDMPTKRPLDEERPALPPRPVHHHVYDTDSGAWRFRDWWMIPCSSPMCKKFKAVEAVRPVKPAPTLPRAKKKPSPNL
jgi:hypothetical protein